VDYPDVIDLRRQLFPERDAYHLIGAPLSDLRRLDQVPRDQPRLLIAEGVLHYLSEPEVCKNPSSPCLPRSLLYFKCLWE
jgi:O-methyltransferase involved in polyketide biosynthesis